MVLLKRVSQYTSHWYCNTPPICIPVLLAPLGSKERERCQCSSHLYPSTPPIWIAIRLPFVSQYFWQNLGGCGHRDVPHSLPNLNFKGPPTKPRERSRERTCLQTSSYPCHLRPVIIKLVAWIFEIIDLNPIRGKCENVEGPSHPRKTRVWGDSTQRKRGQCGKYRHQNAENADDWLNVTGFGRPPS